MDSAPGCTRSAGAAAEASIDELKSSQPVKDGTSPRTACLLERVWRAEELPLFDQRAVLKLVDTLVQTGP